MLLLERVDREKSDLAVHFGVTQIAHILKEKEMFRRRGGLEDQVTVISNKGILNASM